MRIRSQARSIDSRSSSAEPRTSTPVPKVKIDSESTTPEAISREVTIFTPTADKELEAILSNQEDESDSRPITGASGAAELQKQVSEVEKEEGETEEAQEAGRVSHSKVVFVTNEDEIGEDKVGDLTSKPPGSRGEAAATSPAAKHQLDVPPLLKISQSQAGDFLSPSMSVREPAGSRLSTSQFSGRRSIISRDSMKERQRLNAQVSAIYSGLDARYAGMISDLCRIDRGLDTKGSSAESSTDTSLNNAPVMSRSHILAAHAQIEAILSRASDVKDVDQGVTVKDKETSKAGATDEQAGNQQEAEEDETAESKAKEQNGADAQQQGDGDDQDMEWKSFADTLSKDGGENVSFGGSTSYPSFEEDPDDPNVARSYVSTAGLTGQASEYENNSIVSDEDSEEEITQDNGVLKIY